ncbi:MAG: ABC transporter permease [Gemmatimonadaceae bacterium]
MDTLVQDVRYAARKLLRAPGFTVIAVTTLALGVGATTAVFSIVNGVLLQPLPFDKPERVVFISSTTGEKTTNPMSALDFVDYRDQSRSFVGMAAYDRTSMNATGGTSGPVRLDAAQVGAQFFDLLGVKPRLGRTFTAGEDKTGARRVVVLSHHLWRSHYGADPRVVGQTMRLDGDPYTIIGVAPPSVSFPARVDVYVPLVFQPWMVDPSNRGAHHLYAIGRVKDGVTVAGASTELATIAKRLAVQYPESNTGFSGQVIPLHEQIVGKADKPLYAMLGAVGLVLLIACANVANLLLVRASARESEIAVRTALGAARPRIVRQLVTESLLLSAAGAVIGVALASWAVAAVVAFGPTGLPRLQEVVIDGRVLAFTAGVAVVTGILFGLVPALHAARPDIAQMLRESVRGSTRGGTHRTRRLLVIAEVTLAVVLLVGAGLLIHSFVRLINVDPGFNPERVVAFNLSLPSTKYRYERDVRALASGLTERLREMPGTREVGITFGRPLSNSGLIRTTFEVAGWPPSTPTNRHLAQVHMTSPGYFRAMGVPVRRGRVYTAAEDRLNGERVIVVSEGFAKKYFPVEDPIGKHLRFGITHDTAETGGGADTVQGRIVGVVGDVKQQDLATPSYPAVYAPFNTWPIGFFTVLVRTDGDPRAVQRTIKSVVRDLDAELPIFDLTTMTDAVSASVSQPRFYMLLLGAFAAIALLLAALGIYGVIAYAVSQRTRELGIRVALGATHRKIVRLVIAEGVWLAGAGVVLGVFASLAFSRAIGSLMFGVGKLDPVTLVLAPATLMAAALLGCYLPARRAAGVDPVIAMRND